jgi:hypothetical protein
MNLLMCCTPIGKEYSFSEELRYVLIAAVYFKNLYPQSIIFLGTTPDAEIPNYLYKFITVIRYPFANLPFALARQNFYKNFVNSNQFVDDTLITGCDVLFNKCIDLSTYDYKIAMTYRYHRTMPYCSDLVLVKKDEKIFANEFFADIISTMEWMPPVILDGWADQLSIGLEVGFLKDCQYDGNINTSPKNNQILLLPSDDYLFTPNDVFSSIKKPDAGKKQYDIKDFNALIGLYENKYAVHFKGKHRKKLFFIFAYLCAKNGLVDFNEFKKTIDNKILFMEYFEHFAKFGETLVSGKSL